MKKLIKLLTLATTLGSSLAAGEIHIAAERGNLEEVRRLLRENPGCVSDPEGYHKQTPLHCAACTGRTTFIKVMEFLINNGANVNAQNRYLATPLHYTAVGTDPKAAELLIDNGAIVDAQDRDSGTPLLDAAYYGHFEMVQLLLDRGADVNAADILGDTPLLRAVLHVLQSNKGLDVVKLLIQRGADVEACKPYNKAARKILKAAQEPQPQVADKEKRSKKRTHTESKKASKKRKTSKG